MFGVPASERVFWRNDTCTVRVSYDGDADEVMARGERSWLDDHGIERGFSSH
jgi:hypothetical protein